jgi:sigma-B regulation protein RsbU (phosphoserine phosphatase)
VKGFNTGAVDYITKPFQQEEVLARVETHLALRRLQQELQEKNHQLQQGKEIVEAANVALSAANRRMQDELTLAREIQQGLLPPPNPNWPDLDVICYSVPAYEIGGDFYCYHAFNQMSHPSFASKSLTPPKYALAVGDVSGKGVSAALLMAASLAQFDATLIQPFTPVERLLHLDKAISPYTKPRHQNCAMGYLEIELSQDQSGLARLHIVNAGCVPPYIRRQSGEIIWPEVGGFTLGQGLGTEKGYQQVTLEISKGDMIILTSDGVAEAKNETDEMFGFERLEEMIKSGPHSSAAAMVTHLKDELFVFMGEAEQRDDLTIIVAQT